MNVALQTGAQRFGDGLHDAVLQGDGAEIRRRASCLKLREKDEEGSVYAGEIESTVIEVMEDPFDIRNDSIPERGVERGAETTRSGAGETVHVEKGPTDLVRGEGGREVTGERSRVGVEVREGKTPAAGWRRTQEILVEGPEGSSFVLMRMEVDPVDRKDGDTVSPET